MQVQVLIIGGGATGSGLARDLALRGVSCLLVERRDLAAGASGANHGLLHSGARYVLSDPEAARECRLENALLKRLAPQAIEDTGGLFVAVAGDDPAYVHDFPWLCAACGIEAQSLDPAEARRLEPALSPALEAAYLVPDASVDPFRLVTDNAAQARALGARVITHAAVTGLDLAGGRVARARIAGPGLARELVVEPQVVVAAAGAWAGLVASLAEVGLSLLSSQGTLLVTQERLAQRVINRLRPPADADILVPGGTVSVLGTTSRRLEHPDQCRPTLAEVDAMIADAAAMVPALAEVRYLRAYAGVRPLFGSAEADDDRAVSRGVALLDHAVQGVENLITITGGKLTTYRLMAQDTADLVCAKLGVGAPGRTATEPLPPAEIWRPRGAVAVPAGEAGLVLCQCELVEAAQVDQVSDELTDIPPAETLTALAQRTRVGKGPCQGALCGPRITGRLHTRGRLSGRQGLRGLRRFVGRRWRGLRPVLWGASLAQAELQEALYCGLWSLELETSA